MVKYFSRFLLSVLAMGIFANANAQFPATAPDFTLTDLNGQSWNLYTVLAQGKTVFLDISATWCGPCWAYHNSHALEDVYALHGPNGTLTQDVMVFFLEGDATTTTADLMGTGSNTQGNWVQGTPYPILDAPSNAIPSAFGISYFPTIFRICPDKTMVEAGQLPADALLGTINGCSFPLDVLAQGVGSNLACSNDFAPVLSIKNNGTTDLTSCTISYSVDGAAAQTQNWTGSALAGTTFQVTLPTQTYTDGNHTVSFTLSNPNGTTDGNNINNSVNTTFNVNSAPGMTATIAEPFTAVAFPPANWVLSNPDGATTWTHISGLGAYGQTDGCVKMDFYNYAATNAEDELMMPAMDLSMDMDATLSFDVAYAQYSSSYIDGMKIFVSTDCGATWTTVYSKLGAQLSTAPASTATFTPTSAQWRTDNVDLTPYVGNSKVFVKFVSINQYGNNMYLDNINLAKTVSVSNAVLTQEVSISPNPAHAFVNVSFATTQMENVTMNVYNTVGQLVLSHNAGKVNGTQTATIATGKLAAGIYMLQVAAGGQTVTKRFVVE